MDLKKQLQEKFHEIKDVFFEKEMGLKFLRVETTLRNLEDVTQLSKSISNYLDTIDTTDEEYILDVYSAGTDTTLDKLHLSEHLQAFVQVTLNQKIKDHDTFEGQLIEASADNIIMRWNAKGQFRKQVIAIENIKVIKLSAQLNKEKHDSRN